MALSNESEIIDLGKNPIPGGDPCGVDAGDDENYMFAINEVAKIGRIEADEPDWYKMEDACTSLLSSKSKDIEVAAAFGHCLFKRHSYAGLSAALALLTEMVNNFWDGMYPKRPKRRKARVETLADRFTEGKWFSENKPSGGDFDALDECVTRAEALKTALTEKMPDDPPEFRKFLQGLKSHAALRPKKAEPKPEATPGEGASVAAPAAGGVAVGDIADAGGAATAILAAATYLRKADAADPIAYAAVRVIKWSKIMLPASEAAMTQIPAPEATTVDALQHQMANSMWEPLLKSAEGAFRSQDPFWLDLQRYVCAAMAGLGSKYDHARHAVMGLTGALLQRLGDGLFELRFTNGNPLCSGETRMWLESEVMPAGDGGGGGGSSDNGQMAETTAKARKLAGSGKLKEAIKELQDGLSSSAQRRERFIWRLRIAQICFDAHKLQLAAPLLEECSEEIQKYNIDEWEPSLAVDVAQTLYRCRKSLSVATKDPRPEVLEGVRSSYAWLCQLDPLAALAAEPSGK